MDPAPVSPAHIHDRGDRRRERDRERLSGKPESRRHDDYELAYDQYDPAHCKIDRPVLFPSPLFFHISPRLFPLPELFLLKITRAPSFSVKVLGEGVSCIFSKLPIA